MSAPGGNNFQPESVAELNRFVQYVFANYEKQISDQNRLHNESMVKIERQLSDVSAKIEQHLVTKDQHRSDMEDLKEEIRDQKLEFDEYQNRMSGYFRWLVSSLIIPLVSLVVTIYSLLNGGS